MPVDFQVTIDAHDPGKLAAFWAEALGYVRQPPPEGFATWDDWADQQGIPPERRNDVDALLDPEGKRPRLLFNRVPEGKTAKNRMHLDVDVGGGRSVPIAERTTRVDAAAERLVALGATRLRPVEEYGHRWVVMQDPEGNEFCLQ